MQRRETIITYFDIREVAMKCILHLFFPVFCLTLTFSNPLHASDVSISGTVTDHTGTPLEGVTLTLQRDATLSTLTMSDGTYTLSGQAGTTASPAPNTTGDQFHIQGNMITVNIVNVRRRVGCCIYNVKGERCGKLLDVLLGHGTHTFSLYDDNAAPSIYFIAVTIGERSVVFKKTHLKGWYPTHAKPSSRSAENGGSKRFAGARASAPVDTLLVSKAGYESQPRALFRYTDTHDFTLVPSAIDFTSQSIPLSIQTTLRASHTSLSRYGINPLIATVAGSNNNFDIAIYSSTTEQIQILSFDANLTKTGEITPASISGVKSLVGFTNIPDDGSFVVGYAKDNAAGDEAFEFRITRLNTQGGEIFTRSIFGDISSNVVESEGEPGRAGSGRIVYNPATKKIGFYCSHTRLWDDNVRHQGGHIGFMDLEGDFYTANSWFYSHNFDQRLIVNNGYYYALAHGDAYPRALGFSKWSDEPPRGAKLVDERYFTIPGETGDNTTNTQTGGLLSLPDSTFGVVFSSSTGRSNYDVCYKNLNDEGEVLHTVWLTHYTGSTNAMYPRIVSYGTAVLIAWEEVTDRTIVLKTRIVNAPGELLSSERELENGVVSPFYDLVSLTDGTIVWATLENTSTLALWKIAL